MSARNLIITGRVQGVGFRWFVMRRSRSLGLTGWVRNRRDGSVEVWAEGSPDALTALETTLYEGPPGSMIRDIQSIPSTATGTYPDFDVTY